MKEPTSQIEFNFDSSLMSMTDREFQQLRDLIYFRLGINLTKKKRSMMIGRLQKLLRASGFASFQEYYEYLVNDSSHSAMIDLVNRITTNYSFFYRGKSHFDFFTQKAFPETLENLREKNSRDIRIWSAGCSTGEEPYMLIMLMMDHLGGEYYLWDGGVLATDISEKALQFALDGIYPEDRAKELPKKFKARYFKDMKDGQLSISDKVKKEVIFRKLNLMNESFPFRKPFQMIFCRNVMIYFDKETRNNLLKKFFDMTEPGGYLFIGHSETLGRDQEYYKYIMPAVYQRNQAGYS
jgi:chemotaxis protein methyltransferase CheR